MARLQYSNKALVGNWYEDRLDASHAPIPELERTGKYRVTPLKMIETTPDLYTTTHQTFHTAQQPLVTPAPVQFISKRTLATALHDRQVPEGTPPHGFGATLHRHGPERDMHLLETTTHSAYGGKYADTPERRAQYEAASASPQQIFQGQVAGKIYRDGVSQGIRTGGATDERLQLGDTDPKSHSFVQRSWIGHDGHQQYVARAAAAAAAAAEQAQKNVPGLALRGLGEGGNNHNAAGVEKKFYKKNDALRRDVGIWNE